MADHSITFTAEQNLVLDKLVADKTQAELDRDKAQAAEAKVREQLRVEQERAASLHEQLRAAKTQNASPDEEAIRADEREKFALWVENGGHDNEDIYQATSASGARAIMEFIPCAIRSGEHMKTYAESRKESDPEWPEAYMQKAEDYDFDVNTRVWER